MVSRPAPPTKAPCQDSLSLRLRASLPLTSPARTTRRFIMQKARRHPINGAPTACGQTGSGSVSLPCPGCFSPFPHGTRPLSVFGEYLALPDGPGGFTLDYPCPALLRMPPPPRPLARKGLSPATARLSRAVPVRSRGGPRGPTTPGTRRHDPGLGSSAFARHYLRNHVCFLFLRVLRCFSSPRSPPGNMPGWHRFTVPGCPIRKSRDQGTFAPPPGLSQLVTSFLASRSQGIHRLPCSRFSFNFFSCTSNTRHLPAPRALSPACTRRATRAASCVFVFPACQRSPRPGGVSAATGPRRAAGVQARGPFSFPPPTGLPGTAVEDKGLEPLASCVQGRRSEPTELIPLFQSNN